jgi:hypothetical protein
MKGDYADLLVRIEQPPRWWDENGCPRWSEWDPGWGADPYAEQKALLEIACQACGQRFSVLVSLNSHSLLTILRRREGEASALGERVRRGSVHYGDPPQHGCVGDTMTSESVRVVQFWERDRGVTYGWKRVPELEIAFPAGEEVNP